MSTKEHTPNMSDTLSIASTKIQRAWHSYQGWVEEKKAAKESAKESAKKIQRAWRAYKERENEYYEVLAAIHEDEFEHEYREYDCGGMKDDIVVYNGRNEIIGVVDVEEAKKFADPDYARWILDNPQEGGAAQKQLALERLGLDTKDHSMHGGDDDSDDDSDDESDYETDMDDKDIDESKYPIYPDMPPLIIPPGEEDTFDCYNVDFGSCFADEEGAPLFNRKDGTFGTCPRCKRIFCLKCFDYYRSRIEQLPFRVCRRCLY